MKEKINIEKNGGRERKLLSAVFCFRCFSLLIFFRIQAVFVGSYAEFLFELFDKI